MHEANHDTWVGSVSLIHHELQGDENVIRWDLD